MPPPVSDADSESESPVAAGTPPSWKSMDALLATFTLPGLGAVARVTGIPPLFNRSYVTLVNCCPPGRDSATLTVPTSPAAAGEVAGDEAPIPGDRLPPPPVAFPPPWVTGVSVLEHPTCAAPPVAPIRPT